jgi:putative ABC transport system permease protein
MRFIKKFELGWNMLLHSKLRSWLTIIGIVIGIGAVVAIVSISNGAQQQMEENLNSFGTDQITVSLGSSRAMGFGGGGPDFGGGSGGTASEEGEDPELTARDILAIESVENVKAVAPTVSASEEVIYSSKKSDVGITAINAEDWEYFVDSEMSTGRSLTKADLYSAVVGGRIASGVFEDMQLNRQITINGKTFKVVGIIDDNSNSIYIPMKSLVGVLEDKEEGFYDSLTVIVNDADLIENTTADIQKRLMLSRGILKEEEKDFSVSNMLSMQETISNMLNTLSLFLGSIAAISLLVGGIGIANTLFTSVLEKTREIGIMKAIGARNSDILHIFLINSGLIGFVGGFGGVILGSIASYIIGTLGGLTSSSSSGRGGMMGNFFSSTALSWNLIIFALFFSVIIGMLAGVIPAYRASKLKPVDALRYE